jgi:hypothetical protein
MLYIQVFLLDMLPSCTGSVVLLALLYMLAGHAYYAGCLAWMAILSMLAN